MYSFAYYLCQPMTLRLTKNVHQTLNLGLRFLKIIMSIYIFKHIFKKN